MKAMTTTLIFAAALFCASGAAADDAAPSAAPGQTQPASPDQAAPAPATKESKKAAWESKVRSDCAAEIGPGGVCERMDFDSGLEKCLHKNKAKLSDSCKTATHPHMHGKKEKKGMKTEEGSAKPAEAPTNP